MSRPVILPSGNAVGAGFIKSVAAVGRSGELVRVWTVEVWLADDQVFTEGFGRREEMTALRDAIIEAWKEALGE